MNPIPGDIPGLEQIICIEKDKSLTSRRRGKGF